MKRLLLCLLSFLSLSAAARPAEPLVYEKQVRPILKAYCFECHGEGEKLRGQLDVRLRRLLVAGGESGAAIVPGKAKESLLYQKLVEGAMPPGKKKLTPEETALIGRWIDEGARTAGPEPERLPRGLQITAEERSFWAFQPVRRPTPPAVRRADLVRTPIDAFLLARLEAQGLSFNEEADRQTLIRRATFDLHGLPPTPEEVEAFVADKSSDAYEKLIDRLLASPRYGERWGRHWLDIAGYADSDGGTDADVIRPYAYKYRDYVIRAFNTDKPFDVFLQEQLAGDEMVKQPYRNLTPVDVERLTATGFLRMGPDATGAPRGDEPAARHQVLAETLKVVSSAFLGLTLGCAQCHNHRYDPIPQSDYFRLRALFEPAYNPQAWRRPGQRLVSLMTDAERQKAQQVEAEAAKIDAERLKKQQEYIDRTFDKEVAKLPENLREPARLARKTPPGKQTAEQKKLLQEHPSLNVSAGSLYLYDPKAADDLKTYADRAAAVRAKKPVEEFVAALSEVPGQVPASFVHHRGDPEQPKDRVAPGGLTVLDDRLPLTVPAAAAGATSGRRLALARWLTGPRHPLTARVLVNRLWLNHFGRGLVGTPGDFGALGERPTHPELLDWLASDLVAGAWKMKRMHKLLMLSSAYRQSSRRDPAKDAVDADNRLLGRMPVRRLQAEELRDALLAVSGRLNPRAFGPPVPVTVDDVGQIVVGVDTRDSAGRPTNKEVGLKGEEARRSVYVQLRRSQVLSVLEAFDPATLEPNCEARNSSTVAPQALLMMNNAFVITQAEAMANRVRREAGADRRAQAARAWRLAFAAEPTEAELHEATQFLAMQAENLKGKAAAGEGPALTSFCQALLSANRFLYVD